MNARRLLFEANFHNPEERAKLKRRKPMPGRTPVRPNVLDSLIPPVREDCGDCDPEDEGFASCPQCGGDGVLLGALGSRKHYRCRRCGWDFSADPTE